MSYTLKPHYSRRITFFEKSDSRVPAALFSAQCVAPDLEGFPYPLPSKKSDYTCFAQGNNGVVWYAGKTGVTRYDKNAEISDNIIMYFSANRHIPDDNVEKILADGDNLWVLAGDRVSLIEMVMLTCEEKADILLEETNKYVNIRGAVTHVRLLESFNKDSAENYAHCDNDGTFTAGHVVGEIYHYAVMKRKYGENHPKTIAALKDATKSCEACLLLTYIHGRHEGFIARAYHVADDPVPDDGVFYRRNGKTAVCVETTRSKQWNIAGEEIPCDYPIPERLTHLYRDLGYTEDGIVYKGDTSSDEVTSHFMQMRVAHDILGPVDPELDEIIKDACKRTMKHIIDNGNEFIDAGRVTTWAKWSKRYFEGDPTGYVDAPLNSAELLFYLKAVMHITGEKGIWEETYNKLIADGYADLPAQHFNRFFQGAMREGTSPDEELMYGDNMLATMTFWQLCTLETDPVLLEKYRAGYRSWAGTLLREHMPGYDFPYLLGVPDADIDIARDALWFYRNEETRLGAFAEIERHDAPVKQNRSEDPNQPYEISALLHYDERTFHKYDRNPYAVSPKAFSNGERIEGCYVYTFGYWIGRYYGIIDEED